MASNAELNGPFQKGSRAQRVCQACFNGDPAAMQQYAVGYISGGYNNVPRLPEPFKKIMNGHTYRKFWKGVARHIQQNFQQHAKAHVREDFSVAQQLAIPWDALLAQATAAPPDEHLPAWTATQGGLARWNQWARFQAYRCWKRALDTAERYKSPVAPPGKAEFRAAILRAIWESQGRGFFSGFPLSLSLPWGDPRYPSVEHLDGAQSANIVLEIRVVNDMKSINNERELRELIGHLAFMHNIKPRQLPDGWRPMRDFSGPPQTAPAAPSAIIINRE